jgi:hypothetical protein
MARAMEAQAVALRKPRSPRGPKSATGFSAIPRPPSVREGRPSGNSVVYDVDRQHDYPLQIPRYERSVPLQPTQVSSSGGVLNADDLADLRGATPEDFAVGDYYEFRYPSDRSDKGYWITRLEALSRTGSYPPWLAEIIADAPGGGGYSPPPALVYLCNCPDFSRNQYRYFSKFSLEVGQRDWEDTDAGCDRAAGCKHVYATRRYLSDELPLPTENAPTTPGAKL